MHVGTSANWKYTNSHSMGPGGVPPGPNRGQKPVPTSLTASLAQGMNMPGTPAHKPSFLPVDLS